MAENKLLNDATQAEGAELARREGHGLPATRTTLAHVTTSSLEHADRIVIDGLELFANHGVYPEENTLGQKFVVSLTLYTDLSRAGASDDLDASIDYGAVCHAVDAYLREHTFKLIETAAEGVAQLLLDRYSALLGGRVKIEKPWAPIALPLRSVAVEIERTR